MISLFTKSMCQYDTHIPYKLRFPFPSSVPPNIYHKNEMYITSLRLFSRFARISLWRGESGFKNDRDSYSRLPLSPFTHYCAMHSIYISCSLGSLPLAYNNTLCHFLDLHLLLFPQQKTPQTWSSIFLKMVAFLRNKLLEFLWSPPLPSPFDDKDPKKEKR